MNWRRIWIPDAGWVCAALATLYCLFLFDGWRQLFRDSDAGWHIRTGEWILAHRQLPVVDPYSFSLPAQPWFAWEWGADALSAILFQFAGLAGVAVLYASAIGAAVWLWWRFTWLVDGDFLLAWLFAAPMLSTTNLHWLARPHLFGWVLLLLGLALAERRRRNLVAVAALSVIWANVHASFFLLPLLFVLYAFGDWLGERIFTNAAVPAVRTHLMSAAVAAAASLVNPYGWRLHAHLLHYLANSELLDRVAEFQSFNFHVDGAVQILLMIGLACAGAVLALQQGRVAQFFVTVLFLAVGLRSARGLPIVALAVLPIANGAITRALRSAPTGLRPAVAQRLRDITGYSSGLRVLDQRFAGVGLTPVLIAALLLAARTHAAQAHAGFPPDEFPVAAATQAVSKLPPDARILAPDKFGGYLIYHFAGARQVYFDGRSDYYGSAFMKNYIQLVEVRPNWQEELGKYRFTHALLPNRYSLVAALQREGWRAVYNDEVATLLAR